MYAGAAANGLRCGDLGGGMKKKPIVGPVRSRTAIIVQEESTDASL
jgi:hypothetical protein